MTQETEIPAPSGYYRPARVVLKLKGLKYELITLFGKSHTMTFLVHIHEYFIVLATKTENHFFDKFNAKKMPPMFSRTGFWKASFL